MLNLQTVMNRVLEIESQLDSGNVAGAKDDVQVLKEDLEKSGCQTAMSSKDNKERR